MAKGAQEHSREIGSLGLEWLRAEAERERRKGGRGEGALQVACCCRCSHTPMSKEPERGRERSRVPEIVRGSWETAGSSSKSRGRAQGLHAGARDDGHGSRDGARGLPAGTGAEEAKTERLAGELLGRERESGKRGDGLAGRERRGEKVECFGATAFVIERKRGRGERKGGGVPWSLL